MPFAGQSGEDELDLLALATDRDLDVVEQAPGDVHGSFEPLVLRSAVGPTLLIDASI